MLQFGARWAWEARLWGRYTAPGEDAVVLVISAGFAIGLLLGLTGIGGGALMTPFLLLVLHLDPVHAIGTDLAFAFLTKSVSAVQHRRQRTVWLRPAFFISLGSVPASLAASWFVVSQVHNRAWVEQTLPRLLGGVLVLVALLIAGRALGWIKARGDERRERWPTWWQDVLLGVAIGALVGLTSVGSGTLLVAVLLLFFVVPADHLVGLNVLVGALLAFFPMLTYAYHGFVRWPLLGQILIGALPGSVLGAHLVTRAPTRAIRLFLSFLVLLAGVRLSIGL